MVEPCSALKSPTRRRNLPRMAAYAMGNMVGDNSVMALILSPYDEIGFSCNQRQSAAMTVTR